VGEKKKRRQNSWGKGDYRKKETMKKTVRQGVMAKMEKWKKCGWDREDHIGPRMKMS